MPNSVAEGLLAHANELSETDALVLRIFNETGMRAKEVAFLEEDCLEKTRTGKHAMLKFVPYKVLKARRKAGLGLSPGADFSGTRRTDRRTSKKDRDISATI